MNATARWERLKLLFRQSQDVPEEGRRAWLIDACAGDQELLDELERLLASQRSPAGILVDDAQALIQRWLPDAESDVDLGGTSIGPYRLLRLIGEGGMGRVYLAERSDGAFEQTVAMKLVRGDHIAPGLHERFLRERQILARLQHPAIAQLRDGGFTADGAPYFTLEYVEGEPITRWCDLHMLGIAERVRLLLKVCAAVEYAHRNLVVHRDLKPSNILVAADGEPKLLDFGIAKVLAADDASGQTATQSRVMTREYAAPEQVLGEPITTATDVYALGVLLYVLLCGQMPYPRAMSGQISWAKAILEETPAPLVQALDADGADAGAASRAGARATSPSALKRMLRGDLERVVQRALAKNPEMRYSSVGAFADDLRAWHDGRAISDGTRRYRLHKLLRRHWLPLGAGAAAILVALIGSAGIAWEARQRELEAERTLHEQRTTKAVKEFLFSLFTAVDPREAKGKDIRARDLLDRGAQRLDEVRDQPVLASELHSVLGRIYFQLGLYAQASALQQRAIDALKSDGTQSLALAHVEIDRAETLLLAGDLKSAGAIASEAFAIVDAMPPTADIERVRALNALGKTSVMTGDYAQAKRHADAAISIAQKSELDDALMADTLKQAGNAAWGIKQMDQARKLYNEALAISERAQGADSPMVASLHENLAHVLSDQARYAQAAEEMQKALAISTKILGAQHPSVLTQRGYLGLYNFYLGNYATARSLLESVVAEQRAQAGAQSPVVALALANLGLVLAEGTDLDAAENTFGEALRIDEATNGRDSEAAQIALGNLAYVHRLKGELDRAQTELLEVQRNEEKHGIDDDPELYYQLGEVQRLRGNAAQAVDLDRKALQFALAGPGESSDSAALAHDYLGLALRDAGDTAGAERELRAALASFAGYVPNAEHPRAATTRLELALLLATRAESHEEAARLVADAAAIRERFLGQDDSRTRDAQAIAAKMGAAH